MDKKYLIINPGSSSKKYSFFEGAQERLYVHFESEDSTFVVTKKSGKTIERLPLSPRDFHNTARLFLDYLINDQYIQSLREIAAVGFRVVAPGSFFVPTQIIDKTYRQKLQLAEQIAPLHIKELIEEIDTFSRLVPNTIFIGVSDSGFFETLPAVAKQYAIPADIARQLDIHRFGYHGSSMKSVIGQLSERFGQLPENVIVCHLGSGSSISAIKNEQPIDTSMGFTPSEGVPMATRVGDIDPSAVFYLARQKRLSFDQLETFLTTECGLLGLSGKTDDIRELIELEKKGDKMAALALDIFVYRIKKYIGAYVAALGGLDVLVFTATIGERSSVIRKRICAGLEHLGLLLDQKKNNRAKKDLDFIEHHASRAKIAVVKTNEMTEIAKEVARIIG